MVMLRSPHLSLSQVIMSESKQGASPSCRYLYSEPLAAAWMAKHFGMKDVDETGSLKWIDGKKLALIETLGLGASPYIIHPESLHLLEAQNRDLVVDERGVIGRLFGT